MKIVKSNELDGSAVKLLREGRAFMSVSED